MPALALIVQIKSLFVVVFIFFKLNQKQIRPYDVDVLSFFVDRIFMFECSA